MGLDYIPERDYRAGYWMKHFSRALVEHAELYRTTPQDAQQIADLVHAFRTALARTHTPGVVSSSLCRAKNDARRTAERFIRSMAQRIRTDPQIDASLKIQIGLNPGQQRRRRVPPPESVPWLRASAETSGVIRIHVSDSQTGRRARPRSAVGLQLFERVRPREVVDAHPAPEPNGVANVGADETPPGWRFVGVFTATPIRIYPSSTNPGDEVTLVARWFTRRGEGGPFGRPTSLRVPFGAVPRFNALQHDRRALAA